MKIFIENCSSVLWICLNLLRWVGFLVPNELTGLKKKLCLLYFSFWFMVAVGILFIGQSVFLVQVWGDVSKMTGITFLMFTNLAFATKVINVKVKKKAIQAIIKEGDFELRNEKSAEGRQIVNSMNKETTRTFCLYAMAAAIATFGILASTEKNQLPFLAWYPFDISKFPAYQFTLVHQITGIIVAATMNVSVDQVVATLIAVCRCRFQLLNLSLRTLCEDVKLITVEEEAVVKVRLHGYVLQHQAALESAAQIQKCFTMAILAQFTVSVLIICASAYQLAEETSVNIFWMISMMIYLLTMLIQVYCYCNEAHKLTEESLLIADAVYACPWYLCSVSVRRALLIVMVRSRRAAVLTSGGLATLSLTCFLSIVRCSYSFFTVLKQME